MALNFPDPATQTPVNTWSPTSTPSASTNGITYLWDGQKWNAQTNGDAAFWQRVGTTLSPATVGDNISTTGDLTTADATVDTLTSNGLVDAPVGTFSGDVQVASLNSGPLAGFRNQLINGDFRVWQRGQGQAAPAGNSSVFRADRWSVRGAGQSGGTPTQGLFADNANNVYKHRYIANGLTSFSSLAQIIEAGNIRQLAGNEVTISAYSSHPLNVRIRHYDGSDQPVDIVPDSTAMTNIPGSDRYTHTFTIPNVRLGATVTSPGLEVVFYYNSKQSPLANGNYDLWRIQLEPGPVATPFEHRPIGTELALCQRYYQSLFTSVEQVAAHSTSGRDFIFPIQTVSMRPNVTFANGPAFVVLSSDTANSNNFRQYGMGAPETDGFGTVYIKGNFAPAASGGTPDAMAAWQTSSEFNADAEL